MKKRPIIITAAMLLASSCEWTEPEHLNYYRQPAEEKAGYAEYLEALKAYKRTEHTIMVLTMKGSSEYPVLQSQHLMSMPDSADYICVKDMNELHHLVSAEIQEVKEKKGTKVIASVDFAAIESEWSEYEDAIADSGDPAPDKDDKYDFFRSHVERQLASCDKYGCDGIMASYEGNAAGERGELQTIFTTSVKSWKESHPEHVMFLRGDIMNILDENLRNMAQYYVIVLGGNKGAAAYKSQIRLKLRGADKSRIVFETTVPSSENPEQVGDSPVSMAEVILSEQMQDPDFSVLGACVSNAQDDYYNELLYADDDKGMSNPIVFGNYVNIRRAVSVLNPPYSDTL